MAKKPTQNSEGAKKRLANLKPFKKGKSGNPGGRPKGIMQYVRLKTRDGKELVDFALDVMRGKPIDEMVSAGIRERLEAQRWLGDRGFGKPVQEQLIDMTGGGGVVIYLPKEDEE